jgi:hypothetical protein
MWNIVKNKCESSYYTEEVRFVDLTTQTGGALDVPVPVSLGASGTSPNGLVSGAGAVIITNKTGPYMIKQNFQVSRNSNPGNTEFFFQAQVSIDNGVTWVGVGNAANRRITNTSTINLFFDVAPLFVTAGTQFRNVWAKSSVGGDPNNPTVGVAEGVLTHTRPSATLLAAGFQDAPSAIAVIYRLQGYNYK